LHNSSKPAISIVIPCFNEEATVTSLVDRILTIFKSNRVPLEIILINDASLDDSSIVLEIIKNSAPEVQVITNMENLGILKCWQIGSLVARGDLIGLIDADLQNVPEDLFKLFDLKRLSQVSAVQGFRSSIERSSDLRLLYSRTLNFILNFFFRDSARDNKSGFLVVDSFLLKKALNILDQNKFYYPQSFIRIALKKLGAQIIEIETLFQPRLSGESFIKGWRSLKASIQCLFYDVPKAYYLFNFKKVFDTQTFFPKEAQQFLTKFVKSGDDLSFIRKFHRFLYFSSIPLHKWLIRKPAVSIYFQLKKTQYFSGSEIRDFQFLRLKNLINHIYLNVPYYRKIMIELNLTPESFSSLQDIQKLPLLSKGDVRKHSYFDLFSTTHNKKKMHKIATSGSTGEPFVVYADKFQLEVRFATTLRQIEWTGWRFGDKQLRLWHQKLGMTLLQVLREKIDALLLRRSFIPAFEVSPKNLNRFIDKIRRVKPVLIDGYAESFNFLAGYLLENNIEGLTPKAVMSSAQILPDQTRNLIEKSLGTRVYDKYGSREFSGIAYECKENPKLHHVMDESYLLEILVDGRPAKIGEIGEVVITDLNNYSFPLVRFRLGDLAREVEQKPCPCGRSLKLIGEIQGRSQAIVHCVDGTWLPGTFFAHFFKDYEHLIKHFQIVQERKDEILLKYVPGNQFTFQGFKKMIVHLEKYLGAKSNLSVLEVDSIPMLATGKRSPVISRVDLDFQKISTK
jgi:phenylacetate-CoA ligase